MILYSAFLPHPPIMIREIGGIECNKISATIKNQAAITKDIKTLESKTDLLVIMSPHAPAGRDNIPFLISDNYTGNLGNFRRNDLSAEFSGDLKAQNKIINYLKDRISVTSEEYSNLDHGVIVPLYELAKQGYEKPILVTGLNIQKQEEHYLFGKYLAEYADNQKINIVFVGSGDMSHALEADGPYEYDPAGPEFDNKIVELIRSANEKDFLKIDPKLQHNAAECGFRSLLTVAGIKEHTGVAGEVLSYEGPFGVGYLTARWN